MDIDERIEHVQKVQGVLWEDRLNNAHRSGSLCTWVSSFHPDHLPCRLADRDLHYGSYNAGCNFKFDDGTSWLVRFPRAGRVHEGYADEKVAMEVAMMNIILRETAIPVPKITAWGLAAQNPLHLGPFIIMDFIDGVSLNDLLKDSNSGTRLLREDVSDEEIKTIYRQFAKFLLQLFQLDFDHIGNLSSPDGDVHFPERPLTWKAHDILQTGKVDTLGDMSKGFTSTTDYFQRVAEQDWDQLLRQPNSAYGPFDAIAKYRTFNVWKSLIPKFIHGDYDRAKFKILCDDLGLANLIVRSREDLTIIGVVDLEWSYVGPAQLSASAPWWLLMDRPTNQAWDCYEGEPSDMTHRYFKYLELFKRVLEEEETNTPGHEGREFSGLVRWSEQSGAMWVHMLLISGFNDPHSFPFTKLIRHIGITEWARLEGEVSEDEATSFGNEKELQFAKYNCDLERVEAYATLMEEGKISNEEFIAVCKSLLA